MERTITSKGTVISSNGNGHKPSLANGEKKPIEKKRATGRLRPINGATKYAHIVGWGMQVPARIMTNAELEGIVETTDEWIRTRTGIHERRIAGERDSVVSLGFEAARQAIDRADVHPGDIDLIIVATSTPEDIYPSSASKIQNLLGATNAGAFDLSAACSGFVYALDMAAQAIRSGSIKTALVIGSEVNSRILDWSDRATCILFGDGAGAVVLEASDDPGGFLSCVLGSDGSGADLLGIPTVGTAVLPDDRLMHKLHMDGPQVFRFATHVIAESVWGALEKAGLTLADVALIVPHQANQRILSASARTLNVPESMFYSNLHKYGNTSAASIPIALCEAEKEGRLKANDNVVIVGFGGGLTWAAAVIQWGVVQDASRKGMIYWVSQGRRETAYVFAFWRARVMQVYRRFGALLWGTPAPRGHIRARQIPPPPPVEDKRTPQVLAPIPAKQPPTAALPAKRSAQILAPVTEKSLEKPDEKGH